MSDDSDEASKTEEPTGKRLDDARKKGNTFSTRELNHFFMLAACIFFLSSMASHVASQTIETLSPFITKPESFEMTPAGVSNMLHDLTLHAATIIALTLLLTFGAAIAPSVVQGKWIFSAEQMKPKLSKLSPLKGLGKMLSKKGVIEFLKNLLKISLVGVATTLVILPYFDELPGLVTIDSVYSLSFSGKLIKRMLVATTMFLFLLSIVDYLYQRFAFLKSQRMTKQEVKDEHKQSDGDPKIKSRLRQIRFDRARKRMMANVPKADVIITNPTHYAIALQYDPNKMAVPKVIAKGTDEVAFRIREIATSHRITIMRNPPLARVLYDTTDIDQEIPEKYYQAVAKIIGYVYRLKGKTPRANKPSYAKPKPKTKGKK